MFYSLADNRKPLHQNDVVEIAPDRRYVIDQYIGCGGFSMMYIAHIEGTSKYVALKELFPKRLDHGFAERQEDGKIVICDPLYEDVGANHPLNWEMMERYFFREAMLTRRAGVIYSTEGNEAQQNNPDILYADGPFRDTKGNLYTAIETAQGETLRMLIERGFVRDAEGRVLFNGKLGEILSVLKDTAKLLSRLHGDNHMLHLDISPDNLYITRHAGGTQQIPHIIDYGSAYDLKDPDEKNCHRFTCNPFSAPEILALAELDDQFCGYLPSEASDTYAVASVLFYSATGTIYTSKMLFNHGWKKQILDEYAPGLYGTFQGESFADMLIDFFEKALSPAVSERFPSANKLYEKLVVLEKTFRASGNLLGKIEPDELASYMILEKYPLFRYKSGNGDLDVLCLGSGVFVKRMILSMLSCGQMLGSHLNIHVVSSDPEADFRDKLLAAAPALEQYSNLGKENSFPEYVTFTYQYVDDLLQSASCSEIAKEFSFCRYIIISLGSNNKNIDLARKYGQVLSFQESSSPLKSVIHYYLSEDAATNVRSDVSADGILGHIELAAFSDDAAAYAKTVRSLGYLALKMKHLYDKLGNPRTSLEDSAYDFSTDAYQQRSSCAAALHLKYKLASIGINPAPSTNRKAIISSYLLKITDLDTRNMLLQLEHQRWLMYMVADGFQFPTMEQIDEYSFRKKGKFNDSFKDVSQKLHHCLVPCGTYGIRLEHLPRDQWDRFASYEEIQATDYDDLDKMSLKVHLLAWKKINRPETGRVIIGLLENNIKPLLNRKAAHYEHMIMQSAGTDEEKSQALQSMKERMEQLNKQYDDVFSSLTTLIETGLYTDESDQIGLLKSAFEGIGIDADDSFQELQDQIKVYIEFSRYRDYKAPDQTIINNLLWVLYSDDAMALIKLCGRTVLDNITGPTILSTKYTFFFGMTNNAEITEYLRSHGNRGEIAYIPCKCLDITDTYQGLLKLRHSINGKVVIDITGSSEITVIAAAKLSEEDKNVSLIRCNPETQRIENLSNFPTAAIYNLTTKISAEEAYALYGTKELPADNRYMLKLSGYVKQLWNFYRKHQQDWEMISAFFSSYGQGISELWIERFTVNEHTSWVPYTTPYTNRVEKYKWDILNLSQLFRQMSEKGLIRDLQFNTRSVGWMSLTFLCPDNPQLMKRIGTFLNYLNVAFPLEYRIAGNTETGLFVSACSSYQVGIWTKSREFEDRRRDSRGKTYSYSKMIPALTDLENMGLINDLEVKIPDDVLSQASIRFFYSSLAVRDCLITAGNVLELYTWYSARQTGYFDDCKANFTFFWQGETAKNEIDVILTKGLTVLAVSCKTAKAKKEHLYEIKYLADHFSLNTKAVIIYSSTMAVDDKGRSTSDLSAVKNRAKAMGVYLININDIEDGSLGNLLKKIADGDYEL